LVLIDFPHQIPEAMKNNNLNEELKVEAPGILAWAIRGCLEWQRGGLNPPEKVLNWPGHISRSRRTFVAGWMNAAN